MNDKQKLAALIEPLSSIVKGYFASIESRTQVKTRIGYAYDLSVFLKAFNGYEGLKQTDIETWLNSFNEKNRARKLACIRSFYAYLCKIGNANGNPAADIEPPKLHRKPIIRLDETEAAQAAKLTRYAAKQSLHSELYYNKTKMRDKAIMALFLGTGIRVSELASLNINDFDFENCSFTVTRKGGNVEKLYFSEEVKRALKIYLENENRSSGELFQSMQHNRLCVRAIQNLVKKYAATITSKKITPHKLRSTYGTLLYQATGDIGLVAEVLGHKDINTTRKHYADISEERKKSAANVKLF